MKNATMLYKAPGSHEIHGHHLDYVIVDEDAIEDHLAEGWSLTPAAAAAALAEKAAPTLQNDDAPPTRAELELKATELSVKFDGRTSDKKLGELIAAALAEKA